MGEMTEHSGYSRAAHHGTGPGEFTPDGCSVQLYTKLPESGEIDVVDRAAPGRGSLLELGCGAGRLTGRLRGLGFRVTAVDESAGMLAHLPDGVTAVRSTIEDLALGERFDVVTLMSFLVNTADPGLCRRLLAACARHVADDGQVLVQREPDDRNTARRPGDSWSRDGMTITVLELEPVGGGVYRKQVGYEHEGTRWTQTYYARALTTAAFESELAAAGLTVDAYLTDDRSWVRAVPAQRNGGGCG